MKRYNLSKLYIVEDEESIDEIAKDMEKDALNLILKDNERRKSGKRTNRTERDSENQRRKT